ncbi:MAG TPA: acyclic terpene utilization AtuA family protein [Candidatus Binatus sp.]|nr:acyclic terpene utilization AtuA family protein [Candidatus Binatus sp.]
MPSTVRVANASGYWGDDPTALARQVRGGTVDYVTLDFLAEITMVILQRQRARDPGLGYAYDFVAMLGPVLPEIVRQGIRVVANAGGVNIPACRDRIAEACRAQALTPSLGVVSGDDLLPRLDELLAAGVPLANLDDARPLAAIRDRIVAANAYLGAWPIAEALGAGAEIVVTGRTTDAALTLGPLVHELGWAWDDWDRLAAGTVAGHVLECGAQATGGNLTDWRKVAPLDVGYPIAEVGADGRFVVTKHRGTGGRVSRATVTEQLLYEIGDPARYLTPDVAADFRGLEVIEAAPDRVAVGGARGTPPTDSLKVTIVYRDGWRAAGLALISGPDVRAKAERLAEMIWHRVGDVAERRAELVGDRACWGAAAPDVEPNEGVFRAAVRDPDRRKVEAFAHTMLGLALQAPPGLGVFGGRPDVQEAYAYWPALVPRELVKPRIEVVRGESRAVRDLPATPPAAAARRGDGEPVAAPADLDVPDGRRVRVPLRRIAYARSGDKGDHANIGVAARSPHAFAFLRRALDAERVRRHFGDLCRGPVERYELPGLRALNFLLRHALGGGGTLSLRADHQGKTLAQGLLTMELDVPESVLETTAAEGEG